MDYSKEYFTIENLNGGTNTLTITKENLPAYYDTGGFAVGEPTGDADAAPAITIYYSFDKTTWNILGTTSTTALTVDFTDKIYLKATCDRWATQLNAAKIWCSTNTIKCSLQHCFSGNIMSLLKGDNFVNDNVLSSINYIFCGLFYNDVTLLNIDNLILSPQQLQGSCYLMMFYNCSGLTTLPEKLFSNVSELIGSCFRLMFLNCTGLITVPKKLLPFNVMAKYCYVCMFYGCTSLITAPDLPATTLDFGSYYNMFYGCTSLITAPDLPATILTERCYYSMFNGCTSLIHPPKMAPTVVNTYSCAFMFNGCTSLLEPTILPALTLASYCYQAMFQDCESLQYFPSLPATTLGDYCYAWMFYGCSSASNTITLPATTLKTQCYRQMFGRCSSLQIAPELPAATLTEYCYIAMFAYDTALIQAPKLKASFIPEGAYCSMFYGCINLNYIECHALQISDVLTTDTKYGSGYTPVDTWLKSVMSVGTFVKHINMNDWTRGTSGIPTRWNVLYVDENGTIYKGDIKTQPEFENVHPKEFKEFTDSQDNITINEFKNFPLSLL